MKLKLINIKLWHNLRISREGVTLNHFYNKLQSGTISRVWNFRSNIPWKTLSKTSNDWTKKNESSSRFCWWLEKDWIQEVQIWWSWSASSSGQVSQTQDYIRQGGRYAWQNYFNVNLLANYHLHEHESFGIKYYISLWVAI